MGSHESLPRNVNCIRLGVPGHGWVVNPGFLGGIVAHGLEGLFRCAGQEPREDALREYHSKNPSTSPSSRLAVTYEPRRGGAGEICDTRTPLLPQSSPRGVVRAARLRSWPSPVGPWPLNFLPSWRKSWRRSFSQRAHSATQQARGAEEWAGRRRGSRWGGGVPYNRKKHSLDWLCRIHACLELFFTVFPRLSFSPPNSFPPSSHSPQSHHSPSLPPPFLPTVLPVRIGPKPSLKSAFWIDWKTDRNLFVRRLILYPAFRTLSV